MGKVYIILTTVNVLITKYKICLYWYVKCWEWIWVLWKKIVSELPKSYRKNTDTLGNRFTVQCCVAQLCLTPCDPMDYSPPGSSVHGILQVRVLKWVAFPFYRESSQPRDLTQVSRITGVFFTIWATREAQEYWSG